MGETTNSVTKGVKTIDGIQNFKNRFSFVSNSLTTVSVLGFKVLRTGSKLGCSLKRKKGLRFRLSFLYFSPKIRVFSKKKKKKVFTSISSLISLFFSQNQGVSSKKKKKKVFTPNRPLSESKTVYAVFEGGPQKGGS